MEHQTEHSRPYPGIALALKTLARDFHLYILSNKPHDAVMSEVEKQGLKPYFRNIWGAGFFKQLKPDPAGIEAALSESRVARTRCVMVGDMEIDIKTACAAEVFSVYVTWGYGVYGTRTLAPSATVQSVAELEPSIWRLLA